APSPTEIYTLSLHDALPILLSDMTTKSSVFNELYSIYGAWGDKENMEKYARLGLKNAQKSGDPEQIASTQYSLAYTFEERYRTRSEEHTSELQSRENLVCRL